MKERPILFSAPMVRAILAGRKTQTRRVVNERDRVGYPHHEIASATIEGFVAMGRIEFAWTPPYAADDTLWVREAWDAPPGSDDRREVAYRADYERDPPGARWRPSIHMPRWASRITLEVTEIRVARLQDITEEDARAEGVTPRPKDSEGDCWTDGTFRTAFHYLWNEINGWSPDSWASNPWVWVVSFRRLGERAP